jgi:NAD-dependent dihydropyrimidine dehydrogenase PreA subunit
MTKKKTKVKVELTRRDVLTVAGAALGSAVAAQFLTTGPLSPFAGLKQEQLTGQTSTQESLSNYHCGMVIDLDKCIGCEYCLRACCATNDVNLDKPWNIVVPDKTSTGQSFFFSRPCLHCQDAPCVEVCPVKATYRREDGLVVMDYDRCIGCR